jgi:5-methylcytosine-specific restriction endonuclease McrA
VALKMQVEIMQLHQKIDRLPEEMATKTSEPAVANFEASAATTWYDGGMPVQSSALERLLRPDEGDLPVDFARRLLELDLESSDHLRYSELSEKAQLGMLTQDERLELDDLLTANDVLTILQAKARTSLRNAPTAAWWNMAESLEQIIRRLAFNRCEYCHFPESATRLTLVLDHVIARQHQGKTELGNLALCCGRCNQSKGPNIAGIDSHTGSITPLYHPRRDLWSDHFRYDGAILIGQSASARATIAVLAINAPIRIATRQALLDAGLTL